MTVELVVSQIFSRRSGALSSTHISESIEENNQSGVLLPHNHKHVSSTPVNASQQKQHQRIAEKFIMRESNENISRIRISKHPQRSDESRMVAAKSMPDLPKVHILSEHFGIIKHGIVVRIISH